MKKTPKKRGPKYPSPKQREAIRILLETRGSIGSAMRQAGYAEKTANNPKNLTQSKAYRDTLNAAGTTEEQLAQTHFEQIKSAKIENMSFKTVCKTKTITHSEKGRKLSKPKVIEEWVHVPDSQIKEFIESVPGHILKYIHKGTHEKVAYFLVPENVVRVKALDMGYKVKGLYAPDKLDVVVHELSDSEREHLLGLYKK